MKLCQFIFEEKARRLKVSALNSGTNGSPLVIESPFIPR